MAATFQLYKAILGAGCLIILGSMQPGEEALPKK